MLAKTRFTTAQALLFCQELVALVDAGMGLMPALEVLSDKARDPLMHTVLQSVCTGVRQGQPLSTALEQATPPGAPPCFPGLLIATVRAAEKTGQISDALKRYLNYQTELNAVKDKIVAASVYPALLMLVGAVVIVFLLGYVVPRFSVIYEEIGSEQLPLLSRWLMLWGGWVSRHSVGMAMLALCGVSALVWGVSQTPFRAWLGQRLWHLPGVGDYWRIYQLAQFIRTLAMLLKGGVPLVTALDMTHALLPQPALALGLSAARQAISQGISVAEAFSQHQLSTPIGARLLLVAERSGDLAQGMERVAAFYDAQVARAVAWFSCLFEPVLMIAIGLVIGGVIILMYLPIFELAGSIQ